MKGIMGAKIAGRRPAPRAMVDGKRPIKKAPRMPSVKTDRISAILTIGPVTHWEWKPKSGAQTAMVKSIKNLTAYEIFNFARVVVCGILLKVKKLFKQPKILNFFISSAVNLIIPAV